MILITGGTGNLGGKVARKLLAHRLPVRVLTRTPAKAVDLERKGAEVVQGSLTNPGSLQRAVAGANAVFSATHAMLGWGRNTSEKVDDVGTRALIDAAKGAGVGHFVYTSVIGASPDHPIDFWRTKATIEHYLQNSGIAYTILRPTAFMEMHAYELIGKAVLSRKKVMLFGPGTNPKNFVATDDVAALAVQALQGNRLRGQIIEIGGPANLTSLQVVKIFENLAGIKAKVGHIPLWVLRILSNVFRPFHPGISRIMEAGIVGETRDQTFDAPHTSSPVPLALTQMEEWAASHYARPLPN